MKRYTARQLFIVKLAALALCALFFPQARVRAQGMAGYIVIFPSVGLVPGQSLRLTLFNPDGAPVRAQAQIHHGGGILVGLGDGSVRAGAFHSFDFNRSDIPLPGEADTGRIQLRASISSVRLTFSEASNPIAVSMEIIEVKDGTSNTVFVGEIPPSQTGGSGNDSISSGFGNDILGIVPGQTLRVTLFNPPSSKSEAELEAQRNPVGGHVKVFDASGNLIAQSPELAIPPGEFRSFNFNRNALPLQGEPGTGRLQVRIKPFFNFTSEQLSRVLASFEIVDNSTGKTQVLTGQQCLVFFSGGIPGN